MAKTRVLVVEPVQSLAASAALQLVASGGEVTVVTSIAEAKRLCGSFDRGMFAFDLPDGSGIILAAEMILEGRVREVGFFHPDEERAAREEHPGGVRTAKRGLEQQDQHRDVAVA